MPISITGRGTNPDRGYREALPRSRSVMESVPSISPTRVPGMPLLSSVDARSETEKLRLELALPFGMWVSQVMFAPFRTEFRTE